MNLKTRKSETKKTAAEVPRKLVPRPAEPTAPLADATATPAIEAPPPAAVTTEAAAAPSPAVKATVTTKKAKAAPVAKAKPARKPTKVQETVAKHQKVLAEALVEAQAIKYDQPEMAKPKAAASKAVAKSAGKPAKAKKPKLVRDSYAMPDLEYAQIGVLKKRLAALGNDVKKSELLRAGIAALTRLDDAELQAVMSKVERIKTGRPSKK